MATALHTTIASGISDVYSHHLECYDNYLDLNFDGTQKSTSILGQIYLSGKANNEVYTLKEMIQQPDRKHFDEAMRK